MFNFQTRMLFVETHYTLATEEAERIGVDHVARLSNTGTIDASTGLYGQSFCMSAKIKMKLMATFKQNCPESQRLSWKFWYEIGLAWPFSPLVVNQPSE